MRFVHTATIAAPIAEVFLYLDDTARMRDWKAGLVDIAYDKPGVPRGVGTRFAYRTQRRNRVTEYPGQITAYRPPSERGTRLELARYGLETVYRLTTEHGGTRVEQVSTVTPKGALARSLSMVAGWPLRRQQHRDFRSLKRVAEWSQRRESRE